MICQAVLPNMDISAALLILNTLLIGVVGYFLRDFIERSKTTHNLTMDNKIEIDLLKRTYQKDVQTLSKSIEDLADSFRRMDEALREKDQELIKELRQLVRGSNERKAI